MSDVYLLSFLEDAAEVQGLSHAIHHGTCSIGESDILHGIKLGILALVWILVLWPFRPGTMGIL